MRSQLGAVDGDLRSGSMRLFSQTMNRIEIASDVAGAADRHQGDAVGMSNQLRVEVGLVETPIRMKPDVDDLGDGSPGQVVRMMLHAACQDHVSVGGEGEPPRQLIKRFGRIFAEDAGLAVWITANELQDCLARRFVGVGGNLTLKACTAMDAAVINHKIVDRLLNRLEGGRGGGIIQVDITLVRPV